MTEAASIEAVGRQPTALATPERRKLLAYAGLLMLLASFATPYGGLISIPVVFFLKNKLHLQAHQTAVFNLWTSVPLFLAFAFGLLRDRWSPFGAGDRGHLVLFGLATAVIYAVIAFINPTYTVMLVGILMVTASIQTVLGSATGLFSEIGQEHLMAGQASAVLNIAGTFPTPRRLLRRWRCLEAGVLEGQDAVGAARLLFLVGAGLMAATALFGALGPARLFTAHAQRPATNLTGDIVRLVRCWPVYPPLILLTLWNFAPAFGTALQYHPGQCLARQRHPGGGVLRHLLGLLHSELCLLRLALPESSAVKTAVVGDADRHSPAAAAALRPYSLPPP